MVVGQTRRTEPSLLTKNPPDNCWCSCKWSPRRYEKGATYEQHPKSPQTYIYIYRLNLAKAEGGWAYDRQPREVWERRKPKANSSYLYSHWRHRLWSEVFFEWRAGFIHNEIYNLIDHNFDRCGDYVFHRILRKYNTPRCRCFDANYLYIWAGERLFLSTSLTPKEVAA